VPVGGGLLYVPAAWIKFADFGVEALMSIYFSMGVSLPPMIPKRPDILVDPAQAAPILVKATSSEPPAAK
jgi:uncharacterized membrane protein